MQQSNALNITFNKALHQIENKQGKLLEDIEINAKPFVKWAGGKRNIAGILLENMPKTFGTYYESFVGGGALFFAAQPEKAVLSDINLDLIITYRVVQQKPKLLIEKLKEHQKNHNKDYYYSIRAAQNLNEDIGVAARFIYLNRTCFNGLYRVNSKGEFNVPMGDYKSHLIVDESNILECNKLLKEVDIYYYPFNKIQPKKSDFIYLDPPYHPINSTSFTKYTKMDFTEADQIALYDYCIALDKAGVKFMLSNSDVQFIKNLYKSFNIQIISAPRTINCKASGRKCTNEVLIRNY